MNGYVRVELQGQMILTEGTYVNDAKSGLHRTITRDSVKLELYSNNRLKAKREFGYWGSDFHEFLNRQKNYELLPHPNQMKRSAPDLGEKIQAYV